MKKSTLWVVALALAGCGNVTHTWDKVGATTADLQRDDARCRNEGMVIAGVNPSAQMIVGYRNCMVAHGWTLEAVD